MSNFEWEAFNWAWEIAAGFEGRVSMCTKLKNDAAFLAPILAKNIYNNKKHYVCPLTLQGHKEAMCYLYMKSFGTDITMNQIVEQMQMAKQLEGKGIC